MSSSTPSSPRTPRVFPERKGNHPDAETRKIEYKLLCVRLLGLYVKTFCIPHTGTGEESESSSLAERRQSNEVEGRRGGPSDDANRVLGPCLWSGRDPTRRDEG